MRSGGFRCQKAASGSDCSVRTSAKVWHVLSVTLQSIIVGAVVTFALVAAYVCLSSSREYWYGGFVWGGFYFVPLGALIGGVIGFVGSITDVLNIEDERTEQDGDPDR